VLAYDSGSSAKLIRLLLGVDWPELGALPPPSKTLLTKSGRLSVVGVGAGDPSKSDAVRLIEGEGRFSADCRGGEGARVDDECVPFVYSLEIEAVAVDVPASATGTGVRGRNTGGRRCCPCAIFVLDIEPSVGAGNGWSSLIFRKLCTVRLARHPSEEEEDSSAGGVMGRIPRGELLRFDVCDDPEPTTEYRSCRCILSADLRCDAGDDDLRPLLRSVLVLALLESRRQVIKDEVNEVEGVVVSEHGARETNEDSILYAAVDGSRGLSVSLGGNSGVDNDGVERRLVVDDDARL